MDYNYLQHYGVKGMKWYQHLFGKKDGTTTSSGKKQHADSDSEKPKEETDEQRRARLLKSTDAKEIYNNRHLLTTNELNDRINRIDTEARLKSKISEEHKQTGMEWLNSKMKRTTDTINNTHNLFKSVDDAYSTVMKSAIGKTMAKKLGLEPPKKEFNLNNFWENRNKMSSQDIQDVAKRIESERKIEEEIRRRNNNS